MGYYATQRQSVLTTVIIILLTSDLFFYHHVHGDSANPQPRRSAEPPVVRKSFPQLQSIQAIVGDHNSSSSLYISGPNLVYKLNPRTLESITETKTGPLLDQTTNEYTNTSTSLLFLNLQNNPPILIHCGTNLLGQCYVISFELKKRWLNDTNPVGFLGSAQSAIALVASSASASRSIWVGWEYDGRRLDQSPPMISARRLTKSGFQYSHSSGSGKDVEGTLVDLHPTWKKSFRTQFVHAFQFKDFIYWVIVQSMNNNDPNLQTKLGRVYKDDNKFFSYSEIPLACPPVYPGGGHDVATAADNGPIGSAMFRELEIDSDTSDVLYVAFASNHAGHNDPSKGSKVCAFTLKSIERVFQVTTRSCFEGDRRGVVLNPAIHGSTKYCSKIPYTDDSLKLGSGVEPYIERVGSQNGHLLTRLNEDLVTTLKVTMQGKSDTDRYSQAVAVVGTENGRIAKIALEKHNHFYHAYETQLKSPTTGLPLAVHNKSSLSFNKQHAYFSIGNELIKYPLDCSAYTTCRDCVVSVDPNGCGWCGGTCQSLSVCPSNRAVCPPVLRDFYPKAGPLEGGTKITITGDNFGGHISSETKNIDIEITVAGVKCIEDNQWTTNEITCRTSRSTVARKGALVMKVTDTRFKDGFDIEGTVNSDEADLGSFEFVEPQILGLWPNKGPRAGGTNVTISGNYLNTGSHRRIEMAGEICTESYNNGKHLYCTTSSTPPEANDDTVRIGIDNLQINVSAMKLQPAQLLETNGLQARLLTMARRVALNASSVVQDLDKTFTYSANPSVTDLSPKIAFTNRESVVKLIGSHLNSVVRPKLRIWRANNIRGKEPHRLVAHCIPTASGTEAYCLIPPYDPAWTPQPQLHHPIDFSVDLILDGVVRNDAYRLSYLPQPVAHKFTDDLQQIALDERVIQINGHNLSTSQDFIITVRVNGTQICNKTEVLSYNEILCYFAYSKDYPRATKLPVTVEFGIGGYHLYHVGNVVFYEALPKGWSAPSIIGLILAILTLIAGGCCALLWIYTRRQAEKKKENMGVAFTTNPYPPTTFTRDSIDARYGVTPNRERPDSGTPLILQGAMASIPFHYIIDSERKALLEQEKLLYPRELLVLLDEIGQGHFGCVFRGTLSLSGKSDPITVAVKTLRNNSSGLTDSEVDAFISEGEMMKDFKHHNVLTLIGFCFDQTDGTPMVITPFMANGDLNSFIRNQHNSPTVRELISWGVQVAEGMAYLSNLKFVHRDLAARNCMLDEHLVVKVADFGLSRDVYERDYYSTDNKKQKMPIRWMAIEAIESGIYNTKTDVWSYGVLLWELLTRGVIPYPSVDNWEIINYLKSGRRLPKPNEYCPNILYEVMLSCWAVDPARRPTFADLVILVNGVVEKLQQSKGSQRTDTHVTYANEPIPEYVTAPPPKPLRGQNDTSGDENYSSLRASHHGGEEDGYLRPISGLESLASGSDC